MIKKRKNSKKIFLTIFCGVIVFSFIFQAVSISKNQIIKAADADLKNQQTTKQLEFQKQMRKLWEENSFWTRMLIIASANNASEVAQSTNRLIQNCNDIANTIRPYYGNETASKFNDLMGEHIKLTNKLIGELRYKTQPSDKTENDWYKNASNIVVILCSGNSKLSKNELESMLFNYLKLIKMESSVRLKKDYKTDVNIFDMAHDQAISLADLLSEGTIKQSVDKFQCL